MKIVAWVFWLLVFAALLLFALRNTDPVTVRFYLDADWEGPLVLALLAFFALGVVCGVLACTSRLLRQRREIVGLKRELRARSADRAPGPPEAAV
ncbi:MAG TPA: LapA family protein [Burkholderiales bacterium]|nr:LapA family protein [Burkholderiales bacterium]